MTIGFENIKRISRKSPSKIVLLVIDGVGGLPHPETGTTELESARKFNLDRVAKESLCGLIDPVSPGITPGSGPGHLAIFGYDPTEYNIGRGIIEALGIGLELRPGDIAARGNFCTINQEGTITDRRAARISTEKNAELCQLLKEIKIGGVEFSIVPVKEHRFVLIIRGKDLSPDLTDSDPQQTGMAPKEIVSLDPSLRSGQRAAEIANEVVSRARNLLQGESFANMVLMRGFSQKPDIPTLSEIYQLKPAVIAVYPMYRGLAKLVGMEVLPPSPNASQQSPVTIVDQVESLYHHYGDYDFFFIHFKATDSRGEDGDFEAKVHAIEEVDNALPGLLNLDPEVLIVTGDHSTPANLARHSWHPVPFMLRSRWCFPDKVSQFSERACLEGGLGRFPAVEIMPLAMANALKLDKFGA